ncbi:MAG: pyrroloquinoline quinone biosynthesis protein PqqB [Candidatus Heimdallarchaeota archaeon]|nr:pyrroloquinoline quinone biosynthesis protein PqqB [Candidatus Heimdallarchaeota archaeon]
MKLLFLGTAQDAGVPQIGCNCPNCLAAKSNLKFRRLGPSIALFDDFNEFCYLFDASPDFKHQVDILVKHVKSVRNQPSLPLSGIFLTHAHFGHISGLWSLGKECIDISHVKIFCSSKMSAFLTVNHPFAHLLARGNLSLFPMSIDCEHPFENFSVKPFQVPHRDEFADTVGFLIRTSSKTTIYLPDIDNWTSDIVDSIAHVDIAILDGTFYSKHELPYLHEVPHPPIEETLEILAHLKKPQIYFTHFNHTNPVLNPTSIERKKVLEKGFFIAEDQMIIEL